VKVASVPLPTAAPPPKEGQTPAQKPTTIAGLLGNLFGGIGTTAEPAEQEKSTVALRGSDNTELAAKPKARTRTAGAGPVDLQAKPAPAKPKAVARNVPAPDSKPETSPAEIRQAEARPSSNDGQASSSQQEQQPQMRTAFAPPPRNGLLAGAQPVVPAGSFDARWSGLR
jgi:cell division protein FtsN